MPDRHLVIMLKEPRAGRVKTRLGRDIGMVPATWWFRHQTWRLIRRLEDRRWHLHLAVSPDTALFSRAWPAHLPRLPQGRGDLGHRIGRILRNFAAGPVVIVGGDIPGITAQHIENAFRSLGSHDAVFGPATDGGYWLIGMKRTAPPPRGLFQGVRWSSATTLADTIASLPGLRIAMIDTLSDVDTAADLRALST